MCFCTVFQEKRPKIKEAMRNIARINLGALILILLVIAFLLSACKTQGGPRGPGPELIFTGVRADNPEYVHLDFLLELNDPAHSPERMKLESWQVVLNGREASRAFNVEMEENLVFLTMNVAILVADGHSQADDYTLDLLLSLNPDHAPQQRIDVSGRAEFPGVRAPEFRINAIAILKAELVNTRFRVAIRIANRNPFPVELSSFRYELYGNGRFWADGAERDIIDIPGMSAVEGHLFLPMNFIGMDRRLLDQIIDLVDVNYRFAGEAQVSTGVEYLPSFNTAFDLSGYSQVFED